MPNGPQGIAQADWGLTLWPKHGWLLGPTTKWPAQISSISTTCTPTFFRNPGFREFRIINYGIQKARRQLVVKIKETWRHPTEIYHTLKFELFINQTSFPKMKQQKLNTYI